MVLKTEEQRATARAVIIYMIKMLEDQQAGYKAETTDADLTTQIGLINKQIAVTDSKIELNKLDTKIINNEW